MRRVSRGFACALAGIAMTLLAWNGPWSWPGWPGLAVLAVAFPPERSLAALPYAARAAVIALAIAANVAVWGLVAFALLHVRGTAARSEPET